MQDPSLITNIESAATIATSSLFVTEAHQQQAQHNQQPEQQQRKTATRQKKSRKAPVPVEFTSSSESESSDDYSPAELIDEEIELTPPTPPPAPRNKRGSIKRQASIKASKNINETTTQQQKVTKRKKRLVTEIRTPDEWRLSHVSM